MSCTETFEPGQAKPELKDEFPLKGVAGHALELKLTVKHFAGESIFPGGIEFRLEGDEGAALTSAQFAFPAKESATQPKITTRKLNAEQSESVITIPVLALPKEAGSRELTLPPLPVAVSRSSGQVGYLCTSPHVVFVDDPTANIPNATLKDPPGPLPQIELWEEARNAVLGALIVIPLALLLAWALIRMRGRWKKAPPPPPPIPPWIRAAQKLAAIEASGLLQAERFDEHLDQVSDVLREYLGARYGFDGLESTTPELLRQLQTRAPDFKMELEVRGILQRSDLVKFARRAPTEAECREAWIETRRMVERTTPAPSLDPRGTEAAGAKAEGPTGGAK
jgi:hypothetical protein